MERRERREESGEWRVESGERREEIVNIAFIGSIIYVLVVILL